MEEAQGAECLHAVPKMHDGPPWLTRLIPVNASRWPCCME